MKKVWHDEYKRGTGFNEEPCDDVTKLSRHARASLKKAHVRLHRARPYTDLFVERDLIEVQRIIEDILKEDEERDS